MTYYKWGQLLIIIGIVLTIFGQTALGVITIGVGASRGLQGLRIAHEDDHDVVMRAKSLLAERISTLMDETDEP